MRVPQVSERIKEAPAHALRGVFAGIGQLLLITDKIRNKPPADAPRPRTPDASEKATAVPVSEPAGPPEASRPPEASSPPEAARPAKPTSSVPEPAPGRDFDKTGNVRLISDGKSTKAASGETAAESPPRAAAPPAPEAAETPAEPEAAETPEHDVAEAVPPWPNYAELSLASLRARLRNLDVGQVRELVEYERTHAGRADVIAMFERRIVKLEAGA